MVAMRASAPRPELDVTPGATRGVKAPRAVHRVSAIVNAPSRVLSGESCVKSGE
jgi:hypothetical protein